MSAPDRTGERPAREIAEQAFHLLRAAPVAAWGAYFLGTAPFCVGVVYFVNAMEVYAYAEHELPMMALMLTALFAWMKTWQARYAAHLLATLSSEPVPAWTPRRFLRTLFNQTVIQATGLFALPLAALTAFLYPPCQSFYYNVTALDASGTRGSVELISLAQTEARRWMKQGFVLQWMLSSTAVITGVPIAIYLFYAIDQNLQGGLPSPDDATTMFVAALIIMATVPLSPLGMVVFGNLIALVLTVGGLLKGFLDIDTIFSWAPGAAMNPGTLTALLACCFLATDPVVKAAYVLRCYYGQSLRSGEDLRNALRRVVASASGTALVLLGTSFLTALPAQAQDPAATESSVPASAPENSNAAALDSALQSELRDPIYTWRMPRAAMDDAAHDKNLLERFYDKMIDWGAWGKEKIRDAFRWIRDHMGDNDPSALAGAGMGASWLAMPAMELLLYLLLAGLVVAVVYFAVRQIQAFRTEVPVELAAVAPVDVKIEDESARADALPVDSWLALARDLHAKGEYRLAMRALYLATLSSLASRGYIQIVRYKTNLEYQRELRRRTSPEIAGAFGEGTLLYECVWYGEHTADAEGFESLYAKHQRVCGT